MNLQLYLPIDFKLKFRFLFICCILSGYIAGQSLKTEALLQKVHSARNEQEKLDAILEVCLQNDINNDTFNTLAFSSKILAQKSGNLQKIGMSTYFVAWAYYLKSYNDSARLAIDEALQKINAKDPQLQDVNFKLKSFKTTTYQSEQNNTEALKILFPLLQDVQKSGNKLYIAQTMHLIAIVEGQQKNPRKTIQWEMQAIPLLNPNNVNENNVLSTVYATLGKAYIQLNKSDSAVFYNNEAINNFRRSQDIYNLAITLQRQANLLTKTNDLKNAELILKELSALNDKIHMGDGDMNYWMAFINFYIQSKKYDTAISLIQERLQNAGGVSDRNETKWGIRLTYFEALSACYKALGNTEKYAAVLENIVQAKDSLYALNSSEAIAQLQTKYEVQKKENTIIEQKLELTHKNFIMYGFAVLMVFAAIIGWLVFRNYSRKQKLKMLLQQQQNKIKAEQAVKDAEENERKRIAADLHDNLGSYAASILSNVDHLEHNAVNVLPLKELKGNSQAMVSILSDTIWALKKEKLSLTAISDRVKLMLQRLSPSYPEIHLEVNEKIENDIQLPPTQAYQLFSIIHEAVNNALKHSKASQIQVHIHSFYAQKPSVQVIDNGIGQSVVLNTIDAGNGLFNMRQRAEILGWTLSFKQNLPVGIVVEIAENTTN